MYYPNDFLAVGLFFQSTDPLDALIRAFLSKLALIVYSTVAAVLTATAFRKALLNLVTAFLGRFARELSSSHPGPDKDRSAKDILIEAKDSSRSNAEVLTNLTNRMIAIEKAQKGAADRLKESSSIIESHRAVAEEGLKALRRDVSNIQEMVMDTQSAVQRITSTLLDEALKRRS